MVVNAYTAVGELHGIGLAKQNHAGLCQSGNHGGISGGNIIMQQIRPGGCWQALDVEEVFGRVGNAMQRPHVTARAQQHIGSMRFGQGAFSGHQAKGLQSPVQCFDTSQEMFGKGH
jgi:hypothetical protein